MQRVLSGAAEDEQAGAVSGVHGVADGVLELLLDGLCFGEHAGPVAAETGRGEEIMKSDSKAIEFSGRRHAAVWVGGDPDGFVEEEFVEVAIAQRRLGRRNAGLRDAV